MFKVLHSSAGAGKTHALVKHYLLLSLRQPDPAAYSHILALTFTNKAAAEMRERVLVYLEALASDGPLDGAKADVRNAVMDEVGVTGEELHRRAKSMLTHMLHNWSKVAISTIDAFTRRVVMPFTRDLQLDHELRMTTEEEYYRAKAVDLVLEQAGTDVALTKVLVATCEQLLEDERSWRPDQPLLDLSKQLTKEDALEHLATLREMDSAQFLELNKRLRARVKEFRDRMRKIGSDSCAALDRAGLTEQDLSYGRNGCISYFRKLRDFEGWFDLGKNVAKTLESDKWHSSSATPSAKAAIDGLAPMLRSTIEAVEALRDTEMVENVITEAIAHDLLATATLNAIDQRLEDLKREEGVSFFSDLTRKVMAIVQEEPAPFLYERLGEQYHHFLIDEFQDTSLMQWHALLPLVENALSAGGSVLLVGDAKQAIYRWRNGEARQFVAFPSIFRKEMLDRGDAFESALMRAHVPVEPLASNHRSAKNIIAFNNALAGKLKLELDEKERNVYDRHEQDTVRGDDGYVEVSCYATGKEAEVDGPWELMLKAVNDSLADDFHLGDIAVLVRTKAQGAEASDHLTEQGWDVVSPDGLTLGVNPVVCAVLDLLAWMQRPVDENAALAAQAIASVSAGAGTVDPFPGGLKPREFLRQWRSGYPLISARLPLVTLVCRIAEALGHDPASDVFIMALVNEAHAFSNTGGDDLPGFLEHWERVGKNRSIGGTPGKDAIQVMTVHKAKGLQFPVVIVPEAGKQSQGGKSERIWIIPDPALEGPPSALVKKVKALTERGVKELEEEERLSKLDQLDVLYVALTRPEQRLYISVAGGGNDFLAKALREHLGLEAGAMWNAGERGPNSAKRSSGAGSDGPSMLELTSTPLQGERQLALRRDAPEEWDPVNPDPYRSHGRAVHAMLARVRTPADLPDAVAMESTGWGLGADITAAIAKQLEALLAKPELAPFFGDGLEVHTETTLLDLQGQAVRPDRVVRDGDLFRVLDIKTGAPSERHKEQVRGYTRLLNAVEHKPVEGYLLYVSDGLLVPVES